MNGQDNISYRPAQVEDASAIATFGSDIFRSSFGHLMDQEDLSLYLAESYSVASIEESIRQHHLFVLAFDGTRLAGFAQLNQSTTESCVEDIESKIQLQRLYVREEYQGCGIGRRLVRMAEEWARGAGIKNVWIATWERNPKAERIYERLGYVRIGEMRFKLGEAILKDWVMIKPMA